MLIEDEVLLAVPCLGIKPDDVRHLAIEAIELARKQLREAGLDPFAEGLGADILRQERNGTLRPPLDAHMRGCRLDSVSDAEVVEWWNRSELCRAAENEVHNAVRLASVMALVDQDPLVRRQADISAAFHRAADNLRRFTIWFGNANEPSTVQELDRNIPFELRHRAIAWYAQNEAAIRGSVSGATCNAVFRRSLRGSDVSAVVPSGKPAVLEHCWTFWKMHYDWQVFLCPRCGCLKVVQGRGVTTYKPRGMFPWNPFQKMLNQAPVCFKHPKSTFSG